MSLFTSSSRGIYVYSVQLFSVFFFFLSRLSLFPLNISAVSPPPPPLPFTLHFPVTQRIISRLRGIGCNLMRVSDIQWNALYPPLTWLVTDIVVNTMLWAGGGRSIDKLYACLGLPTNPAATVTESTGLTAVSCSLITGPLGFNALADLCGTSLNSHNNDSNDYDNGGFPFLNCR